jgi:hypothetical protein
MLLAPGGNKSLDAIGEIYDKNGEYAKLKISFYNITNMSKFLVMVREAFIKYALREALITLKHATDMDMFNRRVKNRGYLLHYPPSVETMLLMNGVIISINTYLIKSLVNTFWKMRIKFKLPKG